MPDLAKIYSYPETSGKKPFDDGYKTIRYQGFTFSPNSILMWVSRIWKANLLQIAIDKWREEELAKIEKDPSAYIKTGITMSKAGLERKIGNVILKMLLGKK